jgi:ribonuclease HI
VEVRDMKYYGWINLKKGSKYIAVVKIDGHSAFIFNKMTKQWVQNNDRLSVQTDTTTWDEISEKEALETIRELSKDKNVTL